MKPRARRDSGQTHLFKAKLDQIIDLRHELALLAQAIDWFFLETAFGAAYADAPGQPPLPVRLMAGLLILKLTYDLSDEELTRRWRLNALIQESLAVAVKTKAIQPQDLTQAVVDTTVQEKAAAFPTDAKLCHRARERLVRLAKRYSVRLKQSYARVGKYALIKHQRYAQARQLKRAKRSLRILKAYLGGVMRDIERAIAKEPSLNARFRRELYLAGRVLMQERGERVKKSYSTPRPRSGVHRQGQGAQALRVRRQGQRRNHA